MPEFTENTWYDQWPANTNAALEIVNGNIMVLREAFNDLQQRVFKLEMKAGVADV
jgi:hypothetical protein